MKGVEIQCVSLLGQISGSSMPIREMFDDCHGAPWCFFNKLQEMTQGQADRTSSRGLPGRLESRYYPHHIRGACGKCLFNVVAMTTDKAINSPIPAREEFSR
jgi:hypothetical protein